MPLHPELTRFNRAALAVLPLLAVSLMTAAGAWADNGPPGDSGQALAESDSAYLRQHADNPIDWRAWRPDTLEAAESGNRLIFLSIGYASCHWCHVMERESFMDEDIANTLDGAYIAIKVDREQQPEVDAWFSRVAEAAVGEAGWPVTVILLPDRTPLFAAHYLPQPELLTTLDRLATAWRDDPGGTRQRAAMLTAMINPDPATTGPEQVADPESALAALAGEAEARLLRLADTTFGGFGRAQKFPDETRLSFLLALEQARPDPELRATLEPLLDAFMNGGLSDAVFGGVFRYTVDREMTRPHFEKMLYNQALSASLFYRAGNAWNRPDFIAFADQVVTFTQSTLTLPDGRLGAAVDAEHEGVEGGYYLWPATGKPLPEGVRAVAIGDTVFFAGTPRGPEGESWRAGLARQRTGPPRVIANPITAWNALWVQALVDRRDIQGAEALAEIIWREAWRGDRLMRFGEQPGFLDDYAYLGAAFRRLHLATARATWRQRADLIDQQVLSRFISPAGISFAPAGNTVPDVADVHKDGETPAPLSRLLSSFAGQPASAAIQSAAERLLSQALNMAATRPEQHASLAMRALDIPADRATFAHSRGIAALCPDSATDGATEEWSLVLAMEPGWHVNAAEVHEDHLIPTTVEPGGLAVFPEFPPGEPLLTRYSDVPLNVYGGWVRIPLKTAQPTPQLDIEVRLQACNERVCLLPVSRSLSAHVNAGNVVCS